MQNLKNFWENLKNNSLSNINWSKFFSKEYLFEKNPSGVFVYEQWIYIIFLINFLLGVAVFSFFSKKFYEARPKYRLIRRVSFLWISNSILLLGYNLFRTSEIVVLSIRFVMLLIFSFYLFLIIYFVLYYLFVIPRQMKKFLDARLRAEYKRK